MSQKGFSLIELLVAMALLAILLGMAAPSLSQMLRDNQAAAELNAFIGMLNYARGEAVRRGQVVAVEGPLDADASWQVVRSANDEVLRQFPALVAYAVAPAGEQSVVFDAQGQLDGDEALELTMALAESPSDTQYIRTITVALSGVVSVAKGGDQ